MSSRVYRGDAFTFGYSEEPGCSGGEGAPALRLWETLASVVSQVPALKPLDMLTFSPLSGTDRSPSATGQGDAGRQRSSQLPHGK